MADVATEIKDLAALKHALANDVDIDDPETVFALMQGETNLLEAIEILLERIDEDDVLLKGLERKIAELETRKSTMKSAIERRRNMILMAIEQMPIGDDGKRAPIRLPTATLSARPTPRKLVVEDESSVPSQWWKRSAPSLDKNGLKGALSEAMKPIGQLEAKLDHENDANKRQELMGEILEYRDQLKEQFPGVTLDNGGVTLAIRRN